MSSCSAQARSTCFAIVRIIDVPLPGNIRIRLTPLDRELLRYLLEREMRDKTLKARDRSRVLRVWQAIAREEGDIVRKKKDGTYYQTPRRARGRVY